MVKKTKAEEENIRLDFLKKQAELAAIAEAVTDEKSLSNTTAVYEKKQREDFNSELDLYSEIGSTTPKNRHSLSRRQTLVRK